jgi:hypothetical protein
MLHAQTPALFFTPSLSISFPNFLSFFLALPSLAFSMLTYSFIVWHFVSGAYCDIKILLNKLVDGKILVPALSVIFTYFNITDSRRTFVDLKRTLKMSLFAILIVGLISKREG